MAEKRHLENAPIREALIDLRISSSGPCEIATLNDVAQQVAAEFPKITTMMAGTVSLSTEQQTNKPPSFEQVGVRLESEDQRRVLQFRQNGMTYSVLRPYQEWEQMRDDAKRLWEVYWPVSNAITVSRVATRFINELDLPFPMEGLPEFLVFPPQAPPGMPLSAVDNFFYRTVAYNEELDSQCVLTQAVQGPSDEKLPILLDIDVFKTGEFSMEGAEVWELLEKFRNLKNDLFFDSITEKCAEIFA